MLLPRPYLTAVAGLIAVAGVAQALGIPALRFLLVADLYLLFWGAAVAWLALEIPLARLRAGVDCPVEGWGAAWRDLRARRLSAPAVARAFVTATSFGLLLGVSTSWKHLYPDLAPWSWDARLEALDRALHGGAPWDLLARTVGTGVAPWLDRYYMAVLWVLPFAAGWACWTDRRDRDRVLWTMMFLWIGLGVVAATAVSSAGPRFGPLVGTAGFQDQAARLHGLTPVSAAVESVLLQARLHGGGHPYAGISAFPSLHVATTMTIALILAGWRRWAGYLGGAAVALTLVASVYLGWHYAVDGYASVVAVAAFWRLARPRPTRSRDGASPEPAVSYRSPIRATSFANRGSSRIDSYPGSRWR